jgi:nucleoside-triphosphatase THEP1
MKFLRLTKPKEKMMKKAMKRAPAKESAPTESTEDAAAASALTQGIMVHPLFEHSVLLPTPPIDDIYRIVKRVVLLREIGCVFTGDSGIGKTDAIERVKAMLQQQFPRLCMFTHDAHNQQISSIRAFFKHFLNTVGQKEQKGETYDLRARLVRILVDDARVSGIKLVVIFIDEANAMNLTDFLFLKDVFNDLAREGVQLITILMGQSPDLQQVIDDLRVKGRNDLVGRFAMRVHQIRGFNSVADLQAILGSIDKRELPDRTGISWPAFFVPKAWCNGFRLENEAQRFHDAIALEVSGSITGSVAFPARQTFFAIRSFLVDAAEFDHEAMQLPENAWRRAILEAKLQDAIIRMNGRKVKKQPPDKATK